MIITNTSSTTTTDDSTTMIMPEEEISTVSTKFIIRRRSSAMLLGTCSWIDLAVVVDEDNAYYSPSSNKKRRHDVDVVDIDNDSTTNTKAETRWILRPHRYLNLKHNSEITRERPPPKSQSSQIMIIHPPTTVQPEVVNFSWTDLAIIIQE
ncbi:hypothetical protein FRACYDRAFT_236557 [Fragilariopsis cylindrus CCMP1102]|uniref:Uncharacterized protein n=1 Tax=Fragilariopsis cylindrus CCMP1102 TaxID=635003 RepID=A0A1E7FJD0_9STRA|nr:hypothetical protein FRACYDRAFT_236557 [Fragilariopsis cylindrus CCMP1102]|eukprot:OEU18280.1 hypothetical protein FRACYDRAFT_236557 [Fragilariopsis cylindrus CCMP1102]